MYFQLKVTLNWLGTQYVHSQKKGIYFFVDHNWNMIPCDIESQSKKMSTKVAGIPVSNLNHNVNSYFLKQNQCYKHVLKSFVVVINLFHI